MGRNRTQGPTSRVNGLRNWVSNLSGRVKIGGILTSLAAVVGIALGVMQLWQAFGSSGGEGGPVIVELQELRAADQLELTVSRKTYLRDTGRSTKGYSDKQLHELGVIASTDANIKGLKDQELTLKYTVYDDSSDFRVPERNNKEAGKIVPTTSNESQRLTAFVPLPPEAGVYRIRLRLHRQNGVVLDEVDTASFSIYFAGPQPPEDPIRVLERLYDTDNTSSDCSGCRWQHDNTEQLWVRIPSGWTDVNGTGWRHPQGSMIIGAYLTASPNNTSYLQTYNVPGVQFGSSRIISNMYDYLDQYQDYSDDCQLEGRHNFDFPEFLGHYDVWKNCDETDAALVNLVAWPPGNLVSPGKENITFVSVQLTGEADIEAAMAVLYNINVYAGLPSQSVSASATPEPTNTTTSDNVGARSQERTLTDSTSTADLEAEAEEAARDYYRASGSENWAYTYENLDSETQNMFTEEEWKNKNQCLADINSVTYQILSVGVESASREPVAEVTLRLTFEEGSPETRNTLFVLEDGVWKHRFTEEEINRFKPETSSEEFVADNKC